jgi:hypothetical protein
VNEAGLALLSGPSFTWLTGKALQDAKSGRLSNFPRLKRLFSLVSTHSHNRIKEIVFVQSIRLGGNEAVLSLWALGLRMYWDCFTSRDTEGEVVGIGAVAAHRRDPFNRHPTSDITRCSNTSTVFTSGSCLGISSGMRSTGWWIGTWWIGTCAQ